MVDHSRTYSLFFRERVNTNSVIKYNNALNDYIHPSFDQPISFSKPISIIYSSVDDTFGQ